MVLWGEMGCRHVCTVVAVILQRTSRCYGSSVESFDAVCKRCRGCGNVMEWRAVWRPSVAVWRCGMCDRAVFVPSRPPPGHVTAGVRAQHSGVIRHRTTMRAHQARPNALPAVVGLGWGWRLGLSVWRGHSAGVSAADGAARAMRCADML